MSTAATLTARSEETTRRRRGPRNPSLPLLEAVAAGLLRHPANQALRDNLRSGEMPPQMFARLAHRVAFGLAGLGLASARGLLRDEWGFDHAMRTAIERAGHGDDAASAECWPLLRAALRTMRDLGLIGVKSAEAPLALPGHVAAQLMRDMRTHVRKQDSLTAVGRLYESALDLKPTFEFGDEPSRVDCRWESIRASDRKSRGSFYTPPALIEHVLDVVLTPVIDRAERADGGAQANAIHALCVCDPSCGTGNFLLAAAGRIAQRIERVRGCSGGAALSEAIARCVHGVDVDPLAVELCRTLLWIEARDPTLDPRVLSSRIRCGDALLGAPASLPQATSRREADAWCAAVLKSEPAAALITKPGARPNDFFHWHIEFPEVFVADRCGFDAVVGNPPFLNQLESATASARSHAAFMRERSGGAVRGYADAASAFLLLASEITRAGGCFALVQPMSLLAARDAQPVRRAVLERATMRSLWIANEHVFDASVYVCVPAFDRCAVERGSERGSAIRLFAGPAFTEQEPSAGDSSSLAEMPTWAHLCSVASGVPRVHVREAGVIGDIATATADFRDQYYGLEGFLVEDAALSLAQRADREAFPPLVTTGLIDLAQNHWPSKPTRVHKRLWRSPRIDRSRLERDGELGEWLTTRLRPKILLATQTRVLEAWVDERGEFAPSLPLISIMPRESRDLWRVAAVLASPVCSALALERWGGSAMTADAIKLSARQVMQLPLPTALDAWDRGAECFTRASDPHLSAAVRDDLFGAMAQAMNEAYGVSARASEALLSWWVGRIHRRRMGRPPL